MSKPVVFMFAGQGSQYYQMGKELYENHETFRRWMDHCDNLSKRYIDVSLIDILYRSHGKDVPFDNLIYSNPALLSIEYCLFKVLQEMGCTPDYLLGYSMGEITASVVSEAISLEDGIASVISIANLAERKCQKVDMLVVFSNKDIFSCMPEVFKNCWVTGKNFLGNFVVCGLAEDIENLKIQLDKKNISTQRLPVKYGFHTELIDIIENDFKRLTKYFSVNDFKIPVISSLKATQIHKADADYYWDVIRHPIEFEKTIDWMTQQNDYIFVDVGPSGTLATFVKFILPDNTQSVSMAMMNPYGRDLDSLRKLKSGLTVESLPTKPSLAM